MTDEAEMGPDLEYERDNLREGGTEELIIFFGNLKKLGFNFTLFTKTVDPLLTDTAPAQNVFQHHERNFNC